MPKISVIMPAYNAEKYIAEAIDSILAQTFGDFEFIILNDDSGDRTEEIILSYDDPRIVYLKNEKNLGVAATLNKGLAIAKGEYIARMDADDISHPQRFAKQLARMQADENVAVCGSGVMLFGADIEPSTRVFAQDPKIMKVEMFFSCGLAHPSVMLRTDMIRELGGYDPNFNGMEDYELWVRVLERYGITTQPEILLRYRIHGGQVTQNPSARYREQMRQLKCRQLEGLGIPQEAAEPFFRFCEEGRPTTAEQICALDGFFALAEKVNKERRQYDGQVLCSTFHAVILGAALKLPRNEQLELVGQCRFLRRHHLLLHLLKTKLKKLLGRN